MDRGGSAGARGIRVGYAAEPAAVAGARFDGGGVGEVAEFPARETARTRTCAPTQSKEKALLMEGFFCAGSELPVVTNGELDLARVVGGLDLAEIAVDSAAIHAERADRVVVVRNVEQVIELAPEGEHAAFTEEVETFLQRHVHVAVLRTGESVASAVADANSISGG